LMQLRSVVQSAGAGQKVPPKVAHASSFKPAK
jgi:hypothetical protein